MKNDYIIEGEIVKISINSKIGNVFAIIDRDDFEKINSYKTSWYVSIRENKIEAVVTKVQKNKKRQSLPLHRIIMNCIDDKVVDHINGNTLDNRKTNLRVVTKRENSTNLHNCKNIYYEKGKYGVRINRKRYGRYEKIEDAIKVRNIIEKKIFPLRVRNDNMLYMNNTNKEEK